jgi:hypothetical protein
MMMVMTSDYAHERKISVKFNMGYVIDSAWQLSNHFTISNKVNCLSVDTSNDSSTLLLKISLVDIAKLGDGLALTAADKRILHLMR